MWFIIKIECFLLENPILDANHPIRLDQNGLKNSSNFDDFPHEAVNSPKFVVKSPIVRHVPIFIEKGDQASSPVLTNVHHRAPNGILDFESYSSKNHLPSPPPSFRRQFVDDDKLLLDSERKMSNRQPPSPPPRRIFPPNNDQPDFSSLNGNHHDSAHNKSIKSGTMNNGICSKLTNDNAAHHNGVDNGVYDAPQKVLKRATKSSNPSAPKQMVSIRWLFWNIRDFL